MMFSVVALLLLAKIGDVHSAPKITCSAPSVMKGDPANITCLFNEDVSLSKKNIKVQRRPPNSATFDPDKMDTVVDCYWLNADDFKCNTGDGYQLFGKVDTKAVVGISHASDDHEGKYMCEIVPSDPSEIEACTFNLKDNPSVNVVTVPVAGQCQEQTEKLQSHVTADIIIVIIGFVTLALLIIFKERLLQCLPKCPPTIPRKKDSEKTDLEIGFSNQKQSLKDGPEKESLLKSPKEESIASPPLNISSDDDGPSAVAATGNGSTDKCTQTRDEMADKLNLSLDDKIKRAKEEVERILKEQDARERLEEIKKKHREARRQEEEEDSRNEREGRALSKKECKERTKNQDQRIKEESNADEKLKKIIKENQIARQRLENEDWDRLNKAKRQESRKRSSSQKDSKQQQSASEPDPAVPQPN